MVVVRLKHVHSATKRLADGRRVHYWYAWKGGPRLSGAPGSPEFVRGYNEAHAKRKAAGTGSLASLVRLYRESPEWKANAASTVKQWSRWLDRIVLDLGTLPLAALNDADVGAEFIDWRNGWQDKPRTADYAIQVLSAVLGWAKKNRKLRINAAEGIEDLYENNRADQIWTDDERARYAMWAPSFEAAVIVDVACLTGLRREDLATLKWSEVGEIYITKATSKSNFTTTATIPLLVELTQLLDAIRANRPDAEYVLTNTRGKPWTPSGLSHAVTAFRGKRLHDCRGTLATLLRKAGLKASEIADIMGWQEKRVERLLAIYVDRDAIVRSIAERIARSDG